MTKTCSICGKEHCAKDLCQKHYNKEYHQKPKRKQYMKKYNQRPEIKEYHREHYKIRKHDKISITFNKFQDLFFATNTETIRRTRQKIQAKNKDLRPTKRVIRKRARNQDGHKAYYGKQILTLNQYMD